MRCLDYLGTMHNGVSANAVYDSMRGYLATNGPDSDTARPSFVADNIRVCCIKRKSLWLSWN